MGRWILTGLILAALASPAAAATVADVTCGALPTTGGTPTQLRLERGTAQAGPFTTVMTVPLPVSGPVTDTTIPAGTQTVVYRCGYNNAAGQGPAGPPSDSTTIVLIPGSPTDKPTVIIKIQ